MRIFVFESDRFRPFLPDARQVNPSVLGFELAEWLARELALCGVVTSYPESADWGWYLEDPGDGAEHLICCGGAELGEGRWEWRVFVTPPRRLFRRVEVTPRSRELEAAVERVLREAGIALEIEAEP